MTGWGSFTVTSWGTRPSNFSGAKKMGWSVLEGRCSGLGGGSFTVMSWVFRTGWGLFYGNIMGDPPIKVQWSKEDGAVSLGGGGGAVV